MRKLFVLLFSFAVMPCFASAIDLPQIPFPAPGSDEILFVVRDTTLKTKDPVNVKVSDFWTNRDIKRKPNKDVYGQSVFTTSGTKWLTSYMTVSINDKDYTMAAVSGYKRGYSAVFVKSAQGQLQHSYDSVANFVGEDEDSIPNTMYLDETPEYFVNVEAYESGNGNILVMCISNKESFYECEHQQ
ncbi:thermostable direct hemolysin (plasmid) [Photobacterium damselae subsp. damselae]|uniref:thermostable direct hemolysin-family toxin n=1 Tax=Photobacterium damselae TaxID=38293 RepID=UPI000A2FB6CB|nr:hemolysin activation protein [Photobacterium damselae subsp. damselae]QAY37610.1 thermostable direct hemolysin [Photobacterium damselae subsp. damselae]